MSIQKVVTANPYKNGWTVFLTGGMGTEIATLAPPEPLISQTAIDSPLVNADIP